MTKAMLVRKSDSAPVGVIMDTSRPQWINDPETGRKLASPAAIGWENDGYKLCEFVPVVVPDGKVAGALTRAFDKDRGRVIEGATLSDRPVRRRLVSKRVIVDRLEAAGLLSAARTALDAAPLHTQERWNARAEIYADDPTAVALLRTIGGDPATILGPEK